MDTKMKMGTTAIRNLLFSKINYNMNDPQKKRLDVLVKYINQRIKQLDDGIKLIKTNKLKLLLPQNAELPSREKMRYSFALSVYFMLVSAQQSPKKNKLTREQCDNLTSDINFLIKKYNLDQKKDRFGYDKNACTKKYKSKKNCTKKMCGG